MNVNLRAEVEKKIKKKKCITLILNAPNLKPLADENKSICCCSCSAHSAESGYPWCGLLKARIF